VFSSPEIWQQFFSRVSCDPQQFRAISQRAECKVEDERYVQYEFNALLRYPVTHVGDGWYIAVDPHLLVRRTTQGMFYDMFEDARLNFTQIFGDPFAFFVGELLGSVCHREALWCEERWKLTVNNREMGRLGKRGDWAFRGQSHLVLFECKSLRPTRELLTYGRQETVEKMYQRLESALLQVVEQSNRIQQGAWTRHGLPPAEIICVVITFGRLSSVNASIVRDRLLERLQLHGLPLPPFLILSIAELDSVVRLVERGDPLDSVLYRMVQSLPSFDILHVFQDDLREQAVSSFVYAIGSEFLNSITELPGHAHDI